MKKLLALVLALVMSMSLVTISNAAFKDADKIDYDEAVTVMNAVGVLVGDENGNFNAKENLTRAQAAKIISYLLLGNKTAEALAGSGKFTDVAKNSWSAGFVDYCASTGVVNGVGDGKFDPNGQLTGYQFAKMLLVALGYDATIEGFTGADWQINVSKRADQADLFDNLDISGNAALTREQAAQMCLNTLKSPLVEYSNKGGSLTVNGATVNIGASNAEYKTSSTKLAEQTIYANKLNSSAGEYIVEFAEQYYPKLVLSEKFDDFERPCYTWSYDKKDLGTFAKTELLEKTFVGEVTGKDLYDLLGKSVVEDYKTFVAIDGVEDSNVNSNIFPASAMNKNNKKAVGATGDGVVTEVYVNNDAKEVYIVIINEYLAIASKDYDSKKESVDLTVYGITSKTVGTATEYLKKTDGATSNDKSFKNVSSDDFALLTEAKEDDAYVVTVAKGELQTVVKADVVEDTAITSFKLGSKVTADGTTYKYASAAEYDFDVLDNYTDGTANGINMKDTTYNIYLDTHGNLLGVDLVEAADNYVFIAGVDSNTSNLSNKTYDASAIFTDGTFQTIKFKADKGDISTALNGRDNAKNAIVNKWCTYTVDKDGVYTLTLVESPIADAKVGQYQYQGTADRDIDKKHIALPANASSSAAYGNDNTVYLLAELKQIPTSGKKAVIVSGVDSVTTGVKNASLTAWGSDSADTSTTPTATGKTVYRGADAGYVSYGTYTLYKSNGYIIATVVVGEDNAASDNLVYVNSGNVEMEAYDKAADEWTWTRKVIADGEETELKVVGDKLDYIGKDAGNGNMKQYGWYQVKYNAKGEVVGTTPVAAALTEGTDLETSIGDLYQTITTGKDTILYTEGFGFDGSGKADATAAAPTMKGSTLYLNKTLTQGFYVAEDAKVVFIQPNDGKTTTEYEVGSKEVQGFIESLNDANGEADNGFSYTVSAILKNGAATVVIINDSIDSTFKKGTEELSSDIQIKSVNLATGTITYYVEDGTAHTFTPEEIAEILANEGCTDISYNGSVWAYKKGLVTYTNVTIAAPTQVFKVTYKVSTALSSGWTVDAPAFVSASETISMTIGHKDWTSNNISVTLSGAATSSATTFTHVAGKTSATADVAISGVTADGEVTVTIAVV